MVKNFKMDFQTPKFWEFALLNNHYQISKNEGNQNFKRSELPEIAWFLQKLAQGVYDFLKNFSLILKSPNITLQSFCTLIENVITSTKNLLMLNFLRYNNNKKSK